MDIKDTTRKRSFQLYLAGSDVEKIFETIPDNGEEKDYDVAATKLTEYFAPKKPIEDDVSEDQDEEATCYAPEEAEAPQRRYPIRNRRQTSSYEAVQGVSKAKTQTF